MIVQANIMGPDLIIVAIVILVLFGGKKIPELAKGLGEGIKNFKEASREDAPAKETAAPATDAKQASTAPTPDQPAGATTTAAPAETGHKPTDA